MYPVDGKGPPQVSPPASLAGELRGHCFAVTHGAKELVQQEVRAGDGRSPRDPRSKAQPKAGKTRGAARSLLTPLLSEGMITLVDLIHTDMLLKHKSHFVRWLFTGF